MLQHLRITNYALIEHVEIDFSPGFTVITGETGAGKSILLGALNLILGQRAEMKTLLNPQKKCIVEGRFDIASYQLKELFERQDWDYENPCIIRREILPSGKSRAFINDTPVLLEQLQELSKQLVDIHSQHQSGILSESSFPFTLLDYFSGLDTTVKQYRERLARYYLLQNEYNELKAEYTREKEQQEYILFLYNELRDASFHPEEQEVLEQKIKSGEHAEQILQNLTFSLHQIYDSENAITRELFEIKKRLSDIQEYSESYKELNDRIEELYIELNDIADTLSRQIEKAQSNPGSLEADRERLSLLYSLLQKHHVQHLDELLKKQSELGEKVERLNTGEEDLNRLKKEINRLKSDLLSLAEQIHLSREKHIPPLERKLTEILQILGMPHAVIKFRLEKKEEIDNFGISSLSLLFSANKGVPPQSLKKIASGGEISRIMFAIKYVMTLHAHLPTLILDEIDTGISGEVAGKTGELMANAGKHIQLISITHLPQIAAKGSYHIKVFKREKNNTTLTELRYLSIEEREQEIAQMLSGGTPGTTAIEHARVLLNS